MSISLYRDEGNSTPPCVNGTPISAKERCGWTDKWSVISTWCNAISHAPKLAETNLQVIEWDRTNLPKQQVSWFKILQKETSTCHQKNIWHKKNSLLHFQIVYTNFQFLSIHTQTIQMDKESPCTWKSFCMQNVWRNIYTTKVQQQLVCKQ